MYNCTVSSNFKTNLPPDGNSHTRIIFFYNTAATQVFCTASNTTLVGCGLRWLAHRLDEDMASPASTDATGGTD